MPSQAFADAVNGARIAMRTCLRLKEHARFLLITDETTRDFGPIFAQAAMECSVEFTHAEISTEDQRARTAFTTDFLRVLALQDGILVATTDRPECANFRITLTKDKRGPYCTVATMPGATVDALATTLDIDYDEIRRMCRDLTLPLIKGREVVVITHDRSGATHTLEFALGGVKRPPIQSLGIVSDNAWGNIPAGETFAAPLERSAKGSIVINGAIGNELVTEQKEAVLQFEDGLMVSHEYVADGRPVRHLTDVEATAGQSDHANWNVIAEFGIGVNKKIRSPTGVQVIDEKMYGTIHIAIGNNVGYGGVNNCPSVHCDMTTVYPTVDIDGHELIRDGDHIFRRARFEDDYERHEPEPGQAWPDNCTPKLIDDHYELDESRGHLLVRASTAQGRITIYPIGDDKTARASYRLARAIEQDMLDLSDLATRTHLNETHLRQLLSLLRLNGVVRP